MPLLLRSFDSHGCAVLAQDDRGGLFSTVLPRLDDKDGIVQLRISFTLRLSISIRPSSHILRSSRAMALRSTQM